MQFELQLYFIGNVISGSSWDFLMVVMGLEL